MKTRKRYDIPGHAHELTSSCYNQNLFLDNSNTCNLLAEAITKAKMKHGFDLWACDFMPEHAHLLLWSRTDSYSISGILQSIKQPVARCEINKAKEKKSPLLSLMKTRKKTRPYHFWQPGGGYDRNIISSKALANSVEYIHNNPVRRGLVAGPEEWLWSSAKDWIGVEEGPLEIDKGSFPVL